MDRKNLTLVSGSNAGNTAHDISTEAVRCGHCGGVSEIRPTGTTYCCPAGELTALRALVADVDARLAVELEDPPHDVHAARLLSHLRSQLHRARREKA